MAHPYHHALSSVKKWGGTVDDFMAVHAWFDASKIHALRTFGTGRCATMPREYSWLLHGQASVKAQGSWVGTGRPPRSPKSWRWSACSVCRTAFHSNSSPRSVRSCSTLLATAQ
jgi:hypothetical protein